MTDSLPPSMPENWVCLDGLAAKQAVSSLAAELKPGHKLFGVKADALAKRTDRDDFLFAVEGRGVAQVHLTYSPRSAPPFPISVEFPSVVAWHSKISEKVR